MTKHMMVDAETLSLAPNAAILSLGALVWDDADPDNIPLPRYWCVDLLSCVLVGLDVSPSTVSWWREKTTEEARAALYSAPRLPLADVLYELSEYWRETGAERLWANGPAADAVWLENAYRASGVVSTPWKYSQVRCFRTLLELARVHPNHRAEPAVPHDARSDTIAQTLDASRALAEIHRMQRYWDERPLVEQPPTSSLNPPIPLF